MNRFASSRAFSLLEVLIAVALFASAATLILALLPGLSRRGTDAADRLAAQRLSDAVKVELDRLAAGGLDQLAARIPLMGESSTGLALVATRNGARVQSLENPGAGTIAPEDYFFQIECRRFPSGPLRYTSGDRVLAMCVQVTWPYRQPGEAASAAESLKHEFIFVTALNR